MTQPTRNATSGRVYLDLRALGRQTGRPTQELLVVYVLERFLYRLATSTHRTRLILKGGMLLATLDCRRPTADIDLLARSVKGDRDRIAEIVRDIVGIAVDDGVVYDTERLTVRTIRDDQLYAGVRLTLPAQVDRARAVLRLDVNVGDPVTPGPVEVEYPGLLSGSFRLLGYPLATVLAEKVVTMIERGAAITRERDFADVVLLSHRHPVDADVLLSALRATSAYRESRLHPLAGLFGELGRDRQSSWTAYVARSGLAESLPRDYGEAIAEVIAFVDPVLTGAALSASWEPTKRIWLDATWNGDGERRRR
ncbi:MAG: nucleotidyl transferase AbiEii/AbiGii toxin family protein [Actinomycetota bacterium]|nr:nucleotidyl transferase AbiEii/AbiGii toxin family protein [Actinomycetota bacterium]